MTTAVNWCDILKFDGFGGGREIASEVRLNCPEFTGEDIYGNRFNIGAAQATISQDYVEGLIRKESTPVDVFRDVNEGVRTSKGEYERTLFKLYNAGSYVRCDRALIDRDKARGARLMEAEATRVLENAIRTLGTQFFYGGVEGSGASKKGFQGLQKFVGDDFVLDAGGSWGGTSALTSAYFVRFNEVDGVSWLFGRDGRFYLSDVVEKDVPDPSDPEKTIPVYQQFLEFYPGFGYFSKYAAVRVANVDVSTAATPGGISSTAFTDEHILVALEKFKGARPDALFMSRKAGILLAASRRPTIEISGTTISTGSVALPSEVYGVPILYTDSLVENEKAWSTESV
ncbi:MAG: hypothetical protein J6K20_06545 [Thermoguttaceae bacterium]|nr:hypothetical protein [Thermoguttaceae bacterium]